MYSTRALATILFLITVLFASSALAETTESVVEEALASSTPAIVDESPTTETTSEEVSTSTEPVLDIEGDVDVPAECEVEDQVGNTYFFSEDDSRADYLGICALHAAKESGLISDYELSYFDGIGLF